MELEGLRHGYILTDIMSCANLQDIDIHQYLEEDPMSRIQLALNVDDLDASIAFYTGRFGTAPAKTRPGYANSR